MSSLVRWLTAALLGGAAALLVACGDQSGLLSSGQGSTLDSALNTVAAAVAAANCNRANNAGQALGDVVRALPDGVDARLRRKLQDGAALVGKRADHDCQNATRTTPTTTTPTDTTTIETDTQPTTPPPISVPANTQTLPPSTGETTPTVPGTSGGGGTGGSGGAAPTP